MTRQVLSAFSLSLVLSACASKDTDDSGAAASTSGETSDPFNDEPDNGDNASSEDDESEDDSDDQQDDSQDDNSEDEDEESEGSDDTPDDEEESDGTDGEEEEIEDEDEDEDEDTTDDGGSTDGTIWVSASGLPTALPPTGSSGVLEITSSAAPAGTVVDVDVSIDLDHSCTKDLTAILESPNGTAVELFDLGAMPVCSSDIESTHLDDEASRVITSGTSPFTGSYRPTGTLSDFDGENAAGVWRLIIVDDTPGDRGTLRDWEIELTLD